MPDVVIGNLLAVVLVLAERFGLESILTPVFIVSVLFPAGALRLMQPASQADPHAYA